MKYAKTLAVAVDKRKLITIAQFFALLCIATIAPLFHYQIVTGPIVNATLFVGTALLGISAGIMIGLIPSVIALSVGTLPATLAPVVPFIMISNAILVLLFGTLRHKSFNQSVIIASLAKFAFLYMTSSIIIKLIFQDRIAQSVSAMMSYPQLLTALAGGILAYLILKKIQSFKVLNQ